MILLILHHVVWNLFQKLFLALGLKLMSNSWLSILWSLCFGHFLIRQPLNGFFKLRIWIDSFWGRMLPSQIQAEPGINFDFDPYFFYFYIHLLTGFSNYHLFEKLNSFLVVPFSLIPAWIEHRITLGELRN